MYDKQVNRLTVGDVLAEDIIVNNQLILNKGTLLSISHIFTLLNLNLKQVKVKKSPQTLLHDQLIHKETLQDSEFALFNTIFQELILMNGINGRYKNLFQSEEELLELQSLFIDIYSTETIYNLLSALKVWDKYSYYHCVDVFIIGTQWFRSKGEKDNLKEIATGLLLHDIGKIKIPREILQKKDKLTSTELEIIKTHVYFGEELLSKLGFSQKIRDMAMYHHTTENGTGYPVCLPNNMPRPIEIKMLSIVDVYSALTLDRPYRTAFSLDEAEEILDQIKKQFDSELLQQFIKFLSN